MQGTFDGTSEFGKLDISRLLTVRLGTACKENCEMINKHNLVNLGLKLEEYNTIKEQDKHVEYDLIKGTNHWLSSLLDFSSNYKHEEVVCSKTKPPNP